MTPDNVADCPACKCQVLTFSQETKTMPQEETNKVRKYLDVFCSQCGVCIEHKIEDYQDGIRIVPDSGKGD